MLVSQKNMHNVLDKLFDLILTKKYSDAELTSHRNRGENELPPFAGGESVLKTRLDFCNLHFEGKKLSLGMRWLLRGFPPPPSRQL